MGRGPPSALSASGGPGFRIQHAMSRARPKRGRRERTDLVPLVAALEGLSSRAAAERLRCSEKTVQRIRRVSQLSAETAGTYTQLSPRAELVCLTPAAIPQSSGVGLGSGIRCDCGRWNFATTRAGNFSRLPQYATLWIPEVAECPRCRPRSGGRARVFYLILTCISRAGASVVGSARMEGVSSAENVTAMDLRIGLQRIVTKTGISMGAEEVDDIVAWAAELNRNSPVDTNRRMAA